MRRAALALAMFAAADRSAWAAHALEPTMAPYINKWYSQDPSDYANFYIAWWFLPAFILLVIRLPRTLRAVVGHRRFATAIVWAVMLAVWLLALNFVIVRIAPTAEGCLPDDTRFWRMARNYVAYPGHGMQIVTDPIGRRLPHPDFDPNHSILILGDSVTFGSGKVYDRIYSWFLAELIAKETGRPSPRIDNYAVPGYTSWQGLLQLRQRLQVDRPDFVIVAFMAYDWTWAEVPDRVVNDGDASTWSRTIRGCTLGLAFRHFFGRKAEGEVSPLRTHGHVRVSPDDYLNNLEMMRRLCWGAKIPILFLELPVRPQLDNVIIPYRRAMEEMLGRRGARIYFLGDRWRERHGTKEFVPGDWMNLTTNGNRLVAAYLVKYLVKYKLLRGRQQTDH